MEELSKIKISEKYTRREILNRFLELDEDLCKLKLADFDNIAAFPATLVLGMYKEMEKIIGKAAKGLIIRSARLSAKKYAEKLKGLGDPMFTVINYLTLWSALGWGRAKLEREEKRIRLILDYTFEGKNYKELFGKSDEPMCWIAFGFVWGLLESALDKEIRGEEKECFAKGDNRCVFEFEWD